MSLGRWIDVNVDGLDFGPNTMSNPNPYLGSMQPSLNLAPYAQTISVAIDNGRTPLELFTYQAGPAGADAILLIHGLQDEADSWRHVFAPLAQTHRVIAMDLPGFGRSTKGLRRYDVPLYVDALLALMDALKLPRATLIGNSMGAIIADALAVMHPARVSRLVLIDGTLRIVSQGGKVSFNLLQWLFADYYDRRYFAKLRQDPHGAYDTLKPYYADLAALPAADRDFLFQRVNERVWDEPQRQASLSIRNGFLRFFGMQAPKLIRQIPALQMPTTVIWGEHDHIVPAQNGEARATLQPGATFHRIAGAGHLPHQERPAELLDVLAQIGLI